MTRDTVKIALAVRSDGLEERLKQIVGTRQGFVVLPPNGDLGDALLIYELGKNPDRDLSRLSHLLDSGSVAEVILTASAPDPELLIRAMRSGVKEFLPQPVNEPELVAALERAVARIGQQAPAVCKSGKRGQVVTVMGAKGGIGTTTIAVNLAAALNAAKPGSTVLVDLRQPLGEIPFFLDLEYTFTWGDVTANLTRLDATYLMSVLAKHASGLFVLPAPGTMDDEGGMGASAAAAILEMLARLFDYVIIDADCSLDETTLKVMELSEAVHLAMVLSLPCLANVKKFLETMLAVSPAIEQRIRLVVNRHLSSSEINVGDAESVVGKKMTWLIPNDYTQSLSAINQGKTLFEVAPKGPLAKAFASFALELGKREKTREENKGSLLRRFFRKTAPTHGPVPQA